MGLVESSQNRSFPWGPAKSRSTHQFSGSRSYDSRARQSATLPGRGREVQSGTRAPDGSFRCQDLIDCQSRDQIQLPINARTRNNSNKRKSDPLFGYFTKNGRSDINNGTAFMDDSLNKSFLSHSDESLCTRDENEEGVGRPFFRTSISFPCNSNSNVHDDSDIITCEEKQTQTSPPSTLNKPALNSSSDKWNHAENRSGRRKNRGRISNKTSNSVPANPRSEPYCELYYEDLNSTDLSGKEEENQKNSLSRASLYINGAKNIVIPKNEKTQVFIKCNASLVGKYDANFKGVQVSRNVWFESNIPHNKRKAPLLFRKQSSESDLSLKSSRENTKKILITELSWNLFKNDPSKINFQNSLTNEKYSAENVDPMINNYEKQFDTVKIVPRCLQYDELGPFLPNANKDIVSDENILHVVPSSISKDELPRILSPARMNPDEDTEQAINRELAPMLCPQIDDKVYLHVANNTADWGTFPVLRLPKLEGQPNLVDILATVFSADSVDPQDACDAEKCTSLPNVFEKNMIPNDGASHRRENNSPVSAFKNTGPTGDFGPASSNILFPECATHTQIEGSCYTNGIPDNIVCSCLDTYVNCNNKKNNSACVDELPRCKILDELPRCKILHSPQKDCGFTCHEQCQDVVSIDCKIALPELTADDAEMSQDEADLLATPINDVSDDEIESGEKHEEGIQEKDYCELSDNEQISTLRRTVCRIQSQMVTSSEIEDWVEKYSSANQGLQIAKEKNGSYRGCLRIHLNLSRPINIVAGTRPPSIYDILQEDRTMEKTLTSFYMPRDAVKAIHITSKTTTREVILALLKKFKVVDNPQKFALYERTYDVGQSMKANLHRLGDSECPLVLAIAWGAQSLTNKRLVLQENDTADIQWDAFSLPELYNFLRILDKEEVEYKNQIRDKYNLLRKRINDRLKMGKS